MSPAPCRPAESNLANKYILRIVKNKKRQMGHSLPYTSLSSATNGISEANTTSTLISAPSAPDASTTTNRGTSASDASTTTTLFATCSCARVQCQSTKNCSVWLVCPPSRVSLWFDSLFVELPRSVSAIQTKQPPKNKIKITCNNNRWSRQT